MSNGRVLIQEDCKKILAHVNLRVLKNKRVLVTGANGLIGQYLVSAIHEANEQYGLKCQIVCVSLHGPSNVIADLLPNPYIIFKKIDLAAPFKIAGHFDYILHAAGYAQPAKFAKDPMSTIAINVDATSQLLAIAERSKGTFIFFSSAEVYGQMPKGMTTFKETYAGNSIFLNGPRAVYAASKRLGEALVLLARTRQVNAKIVRISAVYGPGMPSSDARVMSDFMRKALTEGTITLLDQGKSVRTYGYVTDVVSMILFVALHSKSDIYNVGGREVISIKDLALQIAKQCKATIIVPRTVSKKYFIGRDPSFVKLDLSKIRQEMNSFSFTAFSVGLKNVIEWTRMNS